MCTAIPETRTHLIASSLGFLCAWSLPVPVPVSLAAAVPEMPNPESAGAIPVLESAEAMPVPVALKNVALILSA